MNRLLLGIVAFSLTFVTSSLAQSDLPTYGQIEDIKAARRVYVTSEDEESRGRIIKALGKDKTLQVVGSPDDAEFFIEYGVLSRESHADGDLISKDRKLKAQMRVFTMKDEKRRIVWAKTQERETEHFMGMKMYDSGRPETGLTGQLLKALKKARGN